MSDLQLGDCREVLRSYPENHFDSCVDDAPYGLNDRINVLAMLTAWLAGERYEPPGKGFMGRDWDKCVPGPDTWREVLRVLKPGAFLLVFAGSKTVGLTEMAIRLAGFEIRDQMQWLYGEGMPKALDVSKGINKKLGVGRPVLGPYINRGDKKPCPHRTQSQVYGAENAHLNGSYRPPVTAPGSPEAAEWDGWASALKPAHEPIIIARKPLERGLSLTENVLKWGTGALNIDGCRIEAEGRPHREKVGNDRDTGVYGTHRNTTVAAGTTDLGRWPANLLFDNAAAEILNEQSGNRPGMSGGGKHRADYEGGMFGAIDGNVSHHRGDNGGAARFFYQPKAVRNEKDAGLDDLDWLPGGRNPHVTVKPIDLIRYLVRLSTRAGGRCLDAHMGSGTTGIAAKLEGVEFTGIEWEELSFKVAGHRIAWWSQARLDALGEVIPPPSKMIPGAQRSLFDFDLSDQETK